MKNTELALIYEFFSLTESEANKKEAYLKYPFMVGRYEALLKIFAIEGLLTKEQKKIIEYINKNKIK